MNKVILTNARLVRDPEIMYSQGEKQMAIARFTLAVDKNYKRNADDKANFINCVCFDKIASVVEKHCKQATKINVEGEWMTGSYKNKDGNTVYTNECTISKLEFCESKANNSNNANNGPAPSNVSNDGFMNIPDGVEDGLPF